MNCRQCGHFSNGVPEKEFTLEEWWPCAKGVASLKDYAYKKAYDHRGFGDLVQKRPVQKLPWLINDHDCPEFEEA